MTMTTLLRWLKSNARHAGRRSHQGRTLRIEALEDRTVPATFTVLNSLDSGAGSLRQAVLAANANPGTYTVAFANSVHNITLSSGELLIADNVMIKGSGVSNLTVSGNDASRVFNIASGVTATVADMSITHGRASGELAPGMGGGGAILNQAGANLTLHRVTLSDNQAVREVGSVEFTVAGGALLNLGTATVLSCVFSNNQAIGGGAGDAIGGSSGGAIDSFGSPDGPAYLTATDTVFNNNRAISAASTGTVYFGVGGALNVNGGLNSFDPTQAQVSTAVITGCSFRNNLATGGEGAIGNGGAIVNLGEKTTMTMVGCWISGNRSVGGGGGSTQGVGGGLLNGGGAILNITGCAILDNRAMGGDNGDLSASNPYASGAFGGGISNNFNGVDARGILTISNSYIARNVAQGGSESVGPGGIAQGGGITNSPSAVMVMTNCTVANNSAIGGNGSPGGFGFGGGIDVTNFGSSATIINSVITGNRAVGGKGGTGSNGGNGYGGGIGVSADALVGPTAGSSVTLINSFVSNNVAVGGQGGASANGGDGLGGGLYVSANGTATIIASPIIANSALGGKKGVSGTDGNGFGGGVAQKVGGVFSKDAATIIKLNRATTSSDEVFLEP